MNIYIILCTVSYKAFSTGNQWRDEGKYKFQHLKEEILESGYVLMKNYNRDILIKAKQYQQTVRAKQAIYHYKGYDGILEMRKDLHAQYKFDYGYTMELYHIMSLICYTDFSQLCTEWTSTFRQIYIGESQESINLRQKCYYHLSKSLYEMVQYFGVACHGKLDFVNERGESEETSGIYVSWVDEMGPFFCGMSVQMPLPSFNINLNSPTSTSRAKEVAFRFSGEDGILITFNNNGLHENDRTAFFDASWLSRYKEEEEVYVILSS